MRLSLIAGMRPRYVLGLGLAALATALWIVAVMAGSPDVWTVLSLATVLIGFLMAAGGERSGRAALLAVGFLAVAVGIIMFYRGDLWSSIYNVAGLLFATGALVAATGSWRGSVLAQRWGLAAGTCKPGLGLRRHRLVVVATRQRADGRCLCNGRLGRW